LRGLTAAAAAAEPEQITDAQVSEFKRAVTRTLTKHASAVLLDPEYGLDARPLRAAGCGLLVAYEADGYENPRPHRMLALMPHLSVRRIRDLGADGSKILLSYTPFDDETANDEKRALVERIGNECEALDMPFFLDPVSYDPNGMDPRNFELAQRKPEIVIRTMREFSKDIYKVDVLKVEFPVDARFVEGTSVYSGERAYSREQAPDYYRQADAAARRPYIYLSAGVSTEQFVESVRLAAGAGVRYSGVLCGRATWQAGVPVYARNGIAAFFL
jgi:tagatose 1,6-diphosphate aldolase